MLSVVFWIVPIVSWVMFLSIYTNALNMSINISMISGVLVGTIFLVTGNYMSKNRQNYTVGIKLPWTLNSTENWNRTNRFAGRLWLVAGAIMLVNIFLNQTAILIGMIVVIGVAPVIYSFVLYKREFKRDVCAKNGTDILLVKSKQIGYNESRDIVKK